MTRRHPRDIFHDTCESLGLTYEIDTVLTEVRVFMPEPDTELATDNDVQYALNYLFSDRRRWVSIDRNLVVRLIAEDRLYSKLVQWMKQDG
jgi:hypothetical protein